MNLVRSASAHDVTTDLHGEPGHAVDTSDVVLAKRAAELLNKHYPGHLWAVFVNSEKTGGVMVIKNFRVSYLYGYILHLRNVYTDPTLKCVIRAGGEVLERAHMKRGTADGALARIVEGVKKHHQPIPELGIIR